MFRKSKKNVPASGDEALFEVLGRNKKARRRKIIRTVIIVICLLAAGLTVGVFYLRRQVQEQFAANTQEVLSAQAERGTISTVVSGSGMLANVDTETVSVPSGVEVTEILVKYGDAVEQGDLLATVDMAGVRSAMATLQSEIETLDDDIADAKGDTVSSYVTAGVPGRVKMLYVEQGASVEDTMVTYGALAELSLDGYMAVDIQSDSAQAGDTVTVTLSDGSGITGTVEKTVNGTATVLVTDNGPACGDPVTVKAASGETLGTGELYIHSALKVTGYAGTVGWVNVSLNQVVYASSSLFSLTNTSTSASYDALLRSRSEKEEILLELLQIQKSSGLTAPITGSVYSVADLDSDSTATDIVVLSPDVSMSVTISVDETDILALAVGQTASVTVKSIGSDALSGEVTQIDKTDASGSYTAEILLDKVSGMLPGMTASVDVRIEGVDDAILIPADALHQTSAGYYVYTSYDEQTQEFGGRVDVIPGLSNSNYVEIKSGLSEGDTVYYRKEETFGGMFGGMDFGSMPGGGNSSGMPDFGGGNSGGGMPDFGGGNSGGGMPNFGGGNSGSTPPDFGGSSGGRNG